MRNENHPEGQSIPPDIAAILQRADQSAMTDSRRRQNISLNRAWEQVQRAHDHTDAAVPIRDNHGMDQDFYLIALEDLSKAKKAAHAEMQSTARYLVNELNVKISTVAAAADVTHTTVRRWVDVGTEDE